MFKRLVDRIDFSKFFPGSIVPVFWSVAGMGRRQSFFYLHLTLVSTHLFYFLFLHYVLFLFLTAGC